MITKEAISWHSKPLATLGFHYLNIL